MQENIISTTDKFSTGNERDYSLALKIPAQIFSFVFHPLFIPVIATWYLAFIQKGYFIGISSSKKWMIIIPVAYNTIFFPALSVVLLKALKFINSIFLKTQRERIIPFVAANIFYFWLYLVFRSKPQIPTVLTAFIFGVFLSSSVGLFANSYYKISMHGLGVGALLGLLLLIIVSGSPYSIFLSAMITFLITGFVSTSRMIVSDHKPFDIYSAIVLGIICQVIAAAFIGSSN